MSQQNDTLREKLRQHLEELQDTEDETDLLRGMVEWLVQELLELEFEEYIGADRHERSEELESYRNGYRQRDLFTRVGRLTLRVPRDRDGRFSTHLFERYQRSEKALVLALQESYLQGVSTRKVRHITEKLCGVEFSKDQVSRMAQALDSELEVWRTRPMQKRKYPYLIVDARYEYVREDGRIESDGVLTVKGVNNEGRREILSVAVAPGEDEASWAEVFANLLDRGIDAKEVQMVVSDEHLGLRAAMRCYFPGAMWQRCQTHYQRNAGSKVPKKARPEVHNRLRDVFNAPNQEQAKVRANQLIFEWKDRFPNLVDWLEETIEDALTVFNLPAEHRKRLRTTNGLERFQQEIKRRTRVVRIFPNRASCLRLVTSLAMEQSEEWLTSHLYLDMHVLEDFPIMVAEKLSIKKELEFSSVA
ncbi:MAG: IS256 family transposase [Chloroflexota bacterium]|nr:IS256 family transposase [Chloroflexota bacterium]